MHAVSQAQPSLFDDTEDGARLRHPTIRDVECRRPDVRASTAYHDGCRCPRCLAGKRAGFPNLVLCDFEGCDRKTYKRSTRCMDHVGMCRAPGCSNWIKQERRGDSKYCVEHTTSRARTVVCGMCGAVHRQYLATPYSFCRECREPAVNLISQARKHDVTETMLMMWMAAPYCHLGGERLSIGRSWSKPGEQRSAPGFAIDHDHASACHPHPSKVGCPGCIRGLLCNRCNVLLGSWESLRDRVGAATIDAYLGRTPSVRWTPGDVASAGDRPVS